MAERRGGEAAPYWDRIAALIIDISTILGVYGICIYAQVLLFRPILGLLSSGPVPSLEWPYSLIPHFSVIGLLYAGAYYWRRTPGMAAMNLHLLDARTGRGPRPWQAIVRALPATVGTAVGMAMGGALLIAGAPHGQFIVQTRYFWVPVGALTLILATYLPMAFTANRQSLWDLLSATRVVSKPPAPTETQRAVLQGPHPG